MTDDMQREAFERWLQSGRIVDWLAYQAAIRHMREQEDKA